MIIYMKHPIHGRKVAIAEEEAVADEKNGWLRYEVPALFLPPSTDKPIETINPELEMSELDSLREQWRAKHGKAPHYKKGIDTLRAELT